MRVHVKLFAAYREVVGKSALVEDVPSGSTVEDLVRQLSERHPRLVLLLGSARYAVNREYVASDTRLREEDELVLIPPVSGG